MKHLNHLPLTGTRIYQNPILFKTNPHQVNPDPYILKSRGLYYCYASGHYGVNLSISEDLINWDYKGYAVSETDRQEYWAPAVIYYNGIYYMYCSNVPQGDNNCHHEYLRLYTSGDPKGPFLYRKTLFNKFSIDAHVVRDVNGEFYLFYSVNDYMGTDRNWAGTCILCDRLQDMLTPEGKPLPVVIPSMEEETFKKNRFGDGRDWHTIEGAFYLVRHNTAYLMYSANCYTSENYYIGVCMATKNSDPRCLGWQKDSEGSFQPLVFHSDSLSGTGHNSVVLAPNNVDYWIAYHGRKQAEMHDSVQEERQLCIDPLFFDSDRMLISAPSCQKQTAPFLPTFRDNFRTFNKPWKVIEGHFAVKDHYLYIQNTKGRAVALLPQEKDFYLLEIDVACSLSFLGAEYGILAFYGDAGNYLELRFNAGQGTISLLFSHNGIISCIAVHKLLQNFNFQTYHTVKIRRRFNRFSATLDGIFLFSTDINVPKGAIGLFGNYTSAKFCGFSLTNAVDLWGSDLPLLSNFFCASKNLYEQANGLVNPSFSPTKLQMIKPIKGDSVQNITFRLHDNHSGLVYRPVKSDNENYFVICVQNLQCIINRISGKKRKHIASFMLKNTDFTVRTTVHEKQIWLLVSDYATEAFPFSSITYGSEIELTNGMIIDYSQTMLK